MREWITQKEAAQLEGISKKSLYKRIVNGHYPAEKLREVPGRGGRGGTRTELHISALSARARAQYLGQPEPAPELPQAAPSAARTLPVAPTSPPADRPAGGNSNYWLTAKEAAALSRKSAKTMKRYCQEGVIEPQKFRLMPDGSYQIHAHALDERSLLTFYESQNMPVPDYLRRKLITQLDDIPADERERVFARIDILERFEAYQRQSGQTLEEAAEVFCAHATTPKGRPLAKTTLLRWRRRYAAEGLRGLVHKKKMRTRGRQIDPQAEAFLKSCYLRQGKGSKRLAIEALTVKAAEMQWSIPGESALYRLLNEITPGEAILHREGKKAFEDKVLPSILRDYEFAPMDWWVSDHHPFDVFVLDHQGKKFRPWVTAWMDMKSRKLMSWHITAQPNGESIAYSLHAAISQYGIPKNINIDNGKDFKGRKFTGADGTPYRSYTPEEHGRYKGVYEALGIAVHFAIPYNAKSKPIERLFRRVEEQCCSQMPGYCGSHPKDRPEEFAETYKAGNLLTQEQFEEIVGRWIEEKYHAVVHRGRGMLGRSPQQVFEQDRIEAGYASQEHLRLLLLKFGEQRTYQRHGVQFQGQFYRVAPEWHAKAFQQKYWIRYDPNDLTAISLYHLEDDTFFCQAERKGLAKADSQADLEAIRKEQKAIKETAKQYREVSRKVMGGRDITITERIGLPEQPAAKAGKTSKARGGDAKVTRITPKPAQARKAQPEPAKVMEFKTSPIPKGEGSKKPRPVEVEEDDALKLANEFFNW